MIVACLEHKAIEKKLMSFYCIICAAKRAEARKMVDSKRLTKSFKESPDELSEMWRRIIMMSVESKLPLPPGYDKHIMIINE